MALGQAASSQRGRMKGQVTLQPVKSADTNTSEGNNWADKGEADRKGEERGRGGEGGLGCDRQLLLCRLEPKAAFPLSERSFELCFFRLLANDDWLNWRVYMTPRFLDSGFFCQVCVTRPHLRPPPHTHTKKRHKIYVNTAYVVRPVKWLQASKRHHLLQPVLLNFSPVTQAFLRETTLY